MDQIKSLELCQFEMAAFKMLDHFPNMTRLLIEGLHCRVSTELPETSLKIEHLLVHKGSAMFLYLWLPHVTLPSLITFDRGHSKITTVLFVNAILKEEDFLRILELTPELQTLVYNSPNYRVVDSALTQKVIGRLGWNSVDQISLAKLENLDLSATIKNRGHISDMIRSHSLTKVIVHMHETELDSGFVVQAKMVDLDESITSKCLVHLNEGTNPLKPEGSVEFWELGLESPLNPIKTTNEGTHPSNQWRLLQQKLTASQGTWLASAQMAGSVLEALSHISPSGQHPSIPSVKITHTSPVGQQPEPTDKS
ncbi:hypothetical protein C8J56DRAFT_888515 [Mycena floridula]|nr:hypothetical protein C8J56DRAFT_888515 [Mycena floridula]